MGPQERHSNGIQIALNSHSPKHLHMGEKGEIKRMCSQNMHACWIFNSTPCCSELLPLNCVQNEFHQWPILRERRGEKLYILLLACHCRVEIIIVFFWSPELSHLLHKTMAIFSPCSVFLSLSFIFILLHYNLKLWQCSSPWVFFFSFFSPCFNTWLLFKMAFHLNTRKLPEQGNCLVPL